MELGIIGLARSGKSTVFNTLTRGRVSTSSGATAKSNIGTAKVPDERLGVLAGIFKPKRVINAEVQYIDLLNTPEGLGKDQRYRRRILQRSATGGRVGPRGARLRNPAVPHIQGSVDPIRDIATLDLELTFSDVAILERRLERLDAELKGAKAQERDRINRESALLDNIKERLLEETPLREQELTDEEKKQISALQLLTAKPLLVLLNVGEDQLSSLVSWKPTFSKRSTGQTYPASLSADAWKKSCPKWMKRRRPSLGDPSTRASPAMTRLFKGRTVCLALSLS